MVGELFDSNLMLLNFIAQFYWEEAVLQGKEIKSPYSQAIYGNYTGKLLLHDLLVIFWLPMEIESWTR